MIVYCKTRHSDNLTEAAVVRQSHPDAIGPLDDEAEVKRASLSPRNRTIWAKHTSTGRAGLGLGYPPSSDLDIIHVCLSTLATESETARQ